MTENKVCIGAIVGVHGIKGEVKVKCFSDDEKNFNRYARFTNKTGKQVFEAKSVGHSKELLRVKIKGIDDRNTAETLVGIELYVARDLLPQLKEDEFYHADLIGLSAQNKQGDIIGTVNALYNFGAGDLIEIKMADKRTELLPFNSQYVPVINIKDRYIIIEMMQYAADEDSEEGISDEG